LPHYIVNFLLALNFFMMKNTPVLCEILFETCELEYREMEILLLLLIMIGVKTRKSATWLQFVNTVCTFFKFTNIILYWRESPLHVFVYCLLWLLHFVFLPEPAYTGPQNIQHFRGGHLDNELQRDERITWLICFHTNFSPDCRTFAPVFAEASHKYGDLNNLKFAKFDCNMFPDFAKKHTISTSPLSKQMPTVIMFQKGKEVKRRPFIDSKGSVFKFIFSYDNFVKEFDLNTVYYECKKNQIVVKPVSMKSNEDEVKLQTKPAATEVATTEPPSEKDKKEN